ncbi:MAG TPA: PEGA domain-containing protein, partial [Kofleriaceae bacterium]|nr:PEGA domain-containing protein [Kofleriaceae bacterium]
APIPPTPRPAMPPGWVTAPPPATPPVVPGQAAPGRGRGLVLGLIGAAVLGVGGWQIYARVIAPVRPGDRDAHPIAAAPGDATPASPDAAKLAIASAARDAGSAIAPSGDAARLAAAASDAASNPASDAASAVATAPGDAATPDAPKLAAVPADAASPDAPKLAAAAIDAATPDAPKLAAVPADAATPDAPKLAAVIVDAGGPSDARRAPGDAAQVAATKPPIAPAAPGAAPGDTLAIASTPPGARVFLDGADAGATPVKLAGSPDRHTMALMLAGHELYVAQVDGHGTFQVSLKEVTPTNGPAGIKVLRCKDTNRYYVFVDGKPTGQTCPTERIGCEVGPHTVEVYDAVSETRHKWDIVVKDTRLSFRVRVE